MLIITHKYARVENESGGRDIRETLPTAPDDGNPGLPIAFASQEATELSNPKDNLGDGRCLGGDVVGFVMKGIERTPFVVGENHSTGGIGFATSDECHPENAPGNDGRQSEEGKQAASLGPSWVSPPGKLQHRWNLVVNLKSSANADDTSELFHGVLQREDRDGCQQKASRRLYTGGGIHLLNKVPCIQSISAIFFA